MISRVWDVTFTVSDPERAVGFYGRVLGLPKKYQFSSYVGFDCGGVEIGLVPGQVSISQDGMPCVSFLVEAIDEVHQTLCEQGVRFLKEPHDMVWGGRIAQLADLDGNVLQLVQIDWPGYFAACAPK
jgi:predicted enzyme related to lactoylglutathione lyase